ncbi:MAG: TolC family protein, partial [Muribaculaceae bacterium]|nr:TolC family protein [Muribaculaceae bacterium]
LLRRRPDIVAAEQNLASAAAALGIAKKDFLPTLSLQGSVGVGASRPGDMFTREGLTYSVAPTLSWTVFDGMARSASIAAAREEMEAQIASYNYTVMNAYNEVENAMTSYVNYTRQISDYEAAVQASAEFLSLELDLYTQGLAPYSDVATAQQNVLSNTNSLISARGNALSALISLYEALGGGFE